MDPVTASVLIVIAVLAVEGLVALIYFIRDQTRGVEITKGQIAVSKKYLQVSEWCDVEFSWGLANRNISRPHRINTKETLTMDEQAPKEQQENRPWANRWDGTLSKRVNWGTAGEKDITAELTVVLPDGREFTASATGSVVVLSGGG